MDLKPYYEMVENCIRNLGVDPAQCRGDSPGQWNLTKGSASIWIDVLVNQENHGYFQCMGPVVDIPTSNLDAFYQEVLEINHNLYGVGMTKFKEGIYMKTIRELDGLDETEIKSTINRIGHYTDQYDDYFKNKYFGGESGPPSA